MHISFTIKKCPHCKTFYDFNFFEVNSKLGPPVILCQRCKKPIETGREEWPFSSWRTRLKVLALNGLMLYLCSFAMGDILYNAYQIQTGVFPDPGSIPTGELFFKFFKGMALLLFCFQAFRVLLSIRRAELLRTTQRLELQSTRWVFWTQFKVGLLFIGLLILNTVRTRFHF